MQSSDNRPDSTRAQNARSLLQIQRFGILATVSKRKPGFPFASVTPFSTDADGRPLFLFSALAVHTKNLLEDPKSSLLIFDPGAEDPLNSPRMNVIGEVRQLSEQDLPAARERYLHDHPASRQWMGFGDFAFYRLEIEDVYFVGGFGDMGWVSKSDFSAEGR